MNEMIQAVMTVLSLSGGSRELGNGGDGGAIHSRISGIPGGGLPSQKAGSGEA